MRRQVPARREQTGDVPQDRQQAQVSEQGRSLNAIVADLANCPFFPGKPVSVQLEGGIPKVLTHNFGQAATFFVSRPNYDTTQVPAEIIEAADQSGLDPAKKLRIIASDDCIVDLWLYRQASAKRPL